MGLPPVVAGLFVYLLLSRSGPLGNLGLLFTPNAMVIAQVVLVTPIIAALARQMIEDLWREYGDLYVLDGAVGFTPSVRCCGSVGLASLLRCWRELVEPLPRSVQSSSSAAISPASLAR